jgi:hypothetical protein
LKAKPYYQRTYREPDFSVASFLRMTKDKRLGCLQEKAFHGIISLCHLPIEHYLQRHDDTKI